MTPMANTARMPVPMPITTMPCSVAARRRCRQAGRNDAPRVLDVAAAAAADDPVRTRRRPATVAISATTTATAPRSAARASPPPSVSKARTFASTTSTLALFVAVAASRGAVVAGAGHALATKQIVPLFPSPSRRRVVSSSAAFAAASVPSPPPTSVRILRPRPRSSGAATAPHSTRAATTTPRSLLPVVGALSLFGFDDAERDSEGGSPPSSFPLFQGAARTAASVLLCVAAAACASAVALADMDSSPVGVVAFAGGTDAAAAVSNVGARNAPASSSKDRTLKNAMDSSSWPPAADLLSSSTSSSSSKLSSTANTNTEGSSSSYFARIRNRRYWDVLADGSSDEVARTNERLVDGAVSAINTMYYDSSGGVSFDPNEFYARWKELRSYAAPKPKSKTTAGTNVGGDSKSASTVANGKAMAEAALPEGAFATREDTIRSMKWLVSTLNDPYSKYLTREELRNELEGREDGFLGLGCLVEGSPPPTAASAPALTSNGLQRSTVATPDNLDAFFAIDKFSNRKLYGQRLGPQLPAMNNFPAGRAETRQQPSTVAANRVPERLRPVADRRGNAAGHASRSASSSNFLSVARASNLPVVAAVAPDSPAERAGIVVGDRIASVGTYKFTGMSRTEATKSLRRKFRADNYFGVADLTVAKPIVVGGLSSGVDDDDNANKYAFGDGSYYPRTKVQQLPTEYVVGYKLSRLKSMSTARTAGGFRLDGPPGSIASAGAAAPTAGSDTALRYASLTKGKAATLTPAATTSTALGDHNDGNHRFPSIVGGDAIVHYELLTPQDSIFKHLTDPAGESVGYIRLTRFSRASSNGYIRAVKALEDAGAKSYVIDVRNCYGGVIQEAMLTASTLIRDPHSVLCYTLNSRGGFRPQENMEYVVDAKYPGYFLSSESQTVSRDQVRREHPEYLTEDGWSSPTSYASLLEQRLTRGIRPAYSHPPLSSSEQAASYTPTTSQWKNIEVLADAMSRGTQKKVVILINEGTASAAEVFASALHDNGRAVLVGNKTYGKGLIQHTFPMPDGGGLRLTVAEYLTPVLHHVTKVGGAKYDSGIRPDVRCESSQGIPKNVGADLCVGVALDVLESNGV